MNLKKIKLEPAIVWKLVTCQRITLKNTWSRWVDTWTRDTVRWYWSADSLFWQLSTDRNINVQLVFSWAPKLARKCESKQWFPFGADGRSLGRCTVTWLPNFLGWVHSGAHQMMGSWYIYLASRFLVYSMASTCKTIFTLKFTSHGSMYGGH